MALIFLGVPIIFTIQVSPRQIAVTSSSMMSGLQFTRPQSTGSSGLGAVLEYYHRLQPKPKSVPEFKDAIQLIWSALPEKVIDNAVKDYRK